MQSIQRATNKRSNFFAWPATRLGHWSFGLAAVFVVAMAINNLVLMRLPGERPDWQRAILALYGLTMVACGFASGITALPAIIWRHERSVLVWLPIVVGAFVVFLIVGELLFPH